MCWTTAIKTVFFNRCFHTGKRKVCIGFCTRWYSLADTKNSSKPSSICFSLSSKLKKINKPVLDSSAFLLAWFKLHNCFDKRETLYQYLFFLRKIFLGFTETLSYRFITAKIVQNRSTVNLACWSLEKDTSEAVINPLSRLSMESSLLAFPIAAAALDEMDSTNYISRFSEWMTSVKIVSEWFYCQPDELSQLRVYWIIQVEFWVR